MKICYFAETYPPLISGTSISLFRLVQEFNSRNIEIHVITPFYPLHPADSKIITYPSLPLPGRFDFRLGLPNHSRLISILRQISPDIIHTQQPFLLGNAAIQLARRLGVPVVGTLHTQYDHASYLHYLDPLPRSMSRKVMRNLIRRFCNSLDGVIAPASGMRDHLLEMNVKTPIDVVPNGADLNLVTKEQLLSKNSRSYADTGEPRSLLFVGRMTAEKNLYFLLEAFALIRKTRASAQLVLVGDGPELNPLKIYASGLGIQDGVRFAGRVEHAHISSYYLAADLFVMPSISEVDPLCLKEALVCGLPVVAVDMYASRQILDDGRDSLLTANTILDFADAILTMLADPAHLQTMSRSAVANSARVSIQQQADTLLEIYSRYISAARIQFGL